MHSAFLPSRVDKSLPRPEIPPQQESTNTVQMQIKQEVDLPQTTIQIDKKTVPIVISELSVSQSTIQIDKKPVAKVISELSVSQSTIEIDKKPVAKETSRLPVSPPLIENSINEVTTAHLKTNSDQPITRVDIPNSRPGTHPNQIYVNGFWVDKDRDELDSGHRHSMDTPNPQSKQKKPLILPTSKDPSGPIRVSRDSTKSSSKLRKVYANGILLDESSHNDIINIKKLKSSGSLSNSNLRMSEKPMSTDMGSSTERFVSLIPFVASHLKDGNSIVYLTKFWYEKRLSYGKRSTKFVKC